MKPCAGFGVVAVIFVNIFTKSDSLSVYGSKSQPIGDVKQYTEISLKDTDNMKTEERSTHLKDVPPSKVKHEIKARKQITQHPTTTQLLRRKRAHYCNEQSLKNPDQPPTRRCLFFLRHYIYEYMNHCEKYKCHPLNVKPEKKPEVTIEKIKGVCEFNCDVTLTCIVKGEPEPDIVWKDEASKVIPSEKPIKIEDKYKSLLKLTKLTRTQKYKCVASNKLGKVSDNVNLAVKSPFTVCKDGPHEIILKAGEKKTIVCSIKSKFPIQITWWREIGKKEEEIKTTDKYCFSQDSSQITIIKPWIDIEGKYFCKAKSTQDTTIVEQGIKTDVVFKLAPEVTIDKVQNLLDFRSNVTLTCIVKAHPTPSITWKDGAGKPIVPSSNPTFDGVVHKSIVVLVAITKTQKYTCLASNNLGNASSNIDVTVKSPFESKKDVPHEIILNAGEKKTIDCSIKSSFPIQITWWREVGSPKKEEEIKTSDKYNISKDGSQLSLINSWSYMEGKYYCKAKSSLEESVVEQGIAMNVVFTLAPEVTIDKIQNPVDFRSNVTLTCIVKAYPTPSITWKDGAGKPVAVQPSTNPTYYGVVHKSVVVLVGITKTQKYSCLASNNLGNASSNIDVTVKSPFETKKDVPHEIILKAGEKKTIDCSIKSSFPMQITWWREVGATKKDEEIKTSDKYSISKDGSQLSFIKLWSDMEGKYYCKAKSTQEESIVEQGIVTDVILKLAPEVTIDKIQNPVDFRSNVTLTCILKAHPTPSITWKDGAGKPIVPSSNPTFDGVVHKSIVVLVAITKTQKYTCLASNNLGNASSNIDVTVKSPFESKKDVPNEIILKAGEKKTIDCSIKSSFPMQITWWREVGATKKDEEIKTSDKYSISKDGSQLSFIKLWSDMEGKYYCKAKSTQEESIVEQGIVTDVILKLAPEITIDKIQNPVDFRSNVTLTCIVKAHPTPSITWKDGAGKPVVPKTNPTFDGVVHKSIVVLVAITKTQKYTCLASNNLGNASSNIDVTVKSPFESKKDVPNEIILKAGEKKTIDCSIKSSFPIQITWWREVGTPKKEEEIKTSDKYSISKDGSQLSFIKSWSDMEGKYYCKAKSSIEESVVEQGIVTDVIFKLAPEVTIDKIQNPVDFRSNVTLTCIVKAHPTPSITWKDGAGKPIVPSSNPTFDGVVHKSIVVLVAITKTQKYTCLASNNLGNASSNIDVTVKSPFESKKDVPNEIILKAGEKKTIDCSIKSSFPIQITWWREVGTPKKEEEIKTSDKYSISKDGSQLSFIKLWSDMEGKYYCKAKSSIEESVVEQGIVTDVIFKLAPEVTIDKIQNPVDFRSNVTLTCILKAHPTPSITWKDGAGKPIVPSSNPTFDGVSHKSIVVLVAITKTQKYTCLASNNLGNASSNIDVTVKSPFESKKDVPNEIILKAGEKKTIDCSIKSSFPIQITWWREVGTPKKEEEKIKTSDKYSISKDGSQLSFINSWSDMEGKYYCKAKSTQEESIVEQGIVTDVILKLAPEVTIDKIQNPVDFRSNVTLTCIVKAHPAPSITWKDGAGKPVVPSANPTYDGVVHKSVIVLIGITETQKYTCLASNNLGNASNNIDVTVKPSFEFKKDVPRELIMKTGEKITIECNIKSSIPVQITWWRDDGTSRKGKEVTTSDKYSISKDGSQLTITEPSSDLEGKYFCNAKSTQVENIVEQGFRIYLKFRRAPEVTIDKVSKLLDFGSNITLTCKVKAHPNPLIIWKDDAGKDIPSEEPTKYGEVYTSLLLLFGLNKTQKYYCLASNKLGNASDNVEVTVKSPFTPDKDVPNEVIMTTGEKITIECSIKSSIPIQITWWRDDGTSRKGKEITTSDKYSISKDGSQLTITEPSLDLEGKYFCMAKSTQVENIVEQGFRINIKFKRAPEVTINKVSKLVNYGSNVTLTCKVKAHPKPTIVWKDGAGKVVISEEPSNYEDEYTSLVVVFEIRETQKYYCCASNNLGEACDGVEVTVKSPYKNDKKKSREVIVKAGENITIHCAIKCSFSINVTWWRKFETKEVEIKRSDKYYISKDGSQLTVIKPSLEMEGKYLCKSHYTQVIVDNDFHSDIIKFEDAPRVTVDRVAKLFEFGSNVTLTCRINGYPKPSIFWKDSTGKIIQSEKPTKNYDNYTSHVKLIGLSKTEKYHCCAMNKLGNDCGIIDVTVKSPKNKDEGHKIVFIEPYDGNMCKRS